MSWKFFKEFVRNWKTTGALAPSSPDLARRMVKSARIGQAEKVLELGPGTGALTKYIVPALKPEAKYLGLELNQEFVTILQTRYPELHFEEIAAQHFDFNSYLETGTQFDAIVSGLPWTSFPEALQIDILDHVLPHLAPNGVFVTFAYTGFHLLPGGQRFRKVLSERCTRMNTTSSVWNNAPPAFIYEIHRQ